MPRKLEPARKQQCLEGSLVGSPDVAQCAGIMQLQEKSGGGAFGKLNAGVQRVILEVTVKPSQRQRFWPATSIRPSVFHLESGVLWVDVVNTREVRWWLDKLNYDPVGTAFQWQGGLDLAAFAGPSVVEDNPGLLSTGESDAPAGMFASLEIWLLAVRRRRARREFVTALFLDEQHAGPVDCETFHATKESATLILTSEPIAQLHQPELIGR